MAETDQGKNKQRLVDERAAMAAEAPAEIRPAVLEDVRVEWAQPILDEVAAASD